MIALASGLRVYLACGVTDMRKGMTGLAMLVQQTLAEDPFGGAVFAFRGRRAGLITTGRIALTSAQLAALLDGCEWRAPARARRPELAG